MRTLLLAITAVSLVVPASLTLPASKAEARKHYRERTARHRYQRCRHSSGTDADEAGKAVRSFLRLDDVDLPTCRRMVQSG